MVISGILYVISGFVSGALVRTYGCRPIMIVGSVLATLGYISSLYAPSIYVLYVTFGVFTGKSRVSSETNTAQEIIEYHVVFLSQTTIQLNVIPSYEISYNFVLFCSEKC